MLQYTAFRQPPINALSESGSQGICSSYYNAGLYVMTKSENVNLDTVVCTSIDSGTLIQNAAFLEMTASSYLEGNVLCMQESIGFGDEYEDYRILNELSTQIGCLRREIVMLSNFGIKSKYKLMTH